ncbi:hypothetical protein JK202_06160 [Gluconobacter sp. Dm-62]|uniref:hypothetical protein n=1 Tax=Gluconobacter sp. Dm-62 TaxID=2799804 RepID=UPI001B8C464C|nr:hypothetical protein [Gluconobacter sp. Dm-62]MBS1102601.1 hypothetical protein [Gluconobacter sp. Dm-62]
MNNHPIRLPWVGSRYEDTRVLIMGESHHCDPADEFSLNLTLRAVGANCDGTLPSTFFNDIKDAVLGEFSNATPSKEFWNQFAFANFCQGAVIRKEGSPLEKATPQMYRSGEQALPTIISLLKPRKVLLFSRECWKKYTKNIPSISRDKKFDPITCPDGKKAEVHYYASDELLFAFSCLSLYHPGSWNRSGQSAGYWHPVITDFLSRDFPTNSTIANSLPV